MSGTTGAPASHVPVAAANLFCPCCGSQGSRSYLVGASDYVTGKKFAVRRCSSCGVGFTDPQPPEMGMYYPHRYRQYAGPVQFALRTFYGLRVRQWHRGMGRPGRVLEVGCGNGWMLKGFADHGWTVVGVERSIQQVRHARAHFGLPVFVGDLSTLRTGSQFDLIVIFQVLEHVLDPVGILRDCRRLLRPQGTLIVSVPNLESWQAQLFGGRWFHLDVPRHLVHFTPESLATTLVRAGFDVGAINFFSAHDPYGWIQSALNGMGFRQNFLTELLMARGRSLPAMLAGPLMVAISLILLLPSLALAVTSWACRAGALMEVQAVRKV